MKYSSCKLVGLFFLIAVQAFGGPVVINEIMFHASPAVPENNALEWIELHNKSTNAVSLNGWRFDKGVSFTFTNVTIPAGGYLVVSANTAAFAARNPGVANVVGNWAGILSNNGEEIELVNEDGDTEDSVEFASEGDWAIRQRGPFDLGHYGWTWFCEADGFGKSLELRNPELSNKSGQNWGPSSVDGGTPGRANSLVTTDVAPLISGVSHFPIVPKSSEEITITATIENETTNFSVLLWYRVDANPQNFFTSTPMFDDGLHGDGLAGDGVFGAQLTPRASLTIIDYYIEASDTGGPSRTWPPAAQQLDGSFAQTCNALLEVADDFGLISSHPLYEIILTEIERAELDAIGRNVNGAANSDAAMNGTLISIDGNSTEVRYNTSFRNRGHGSRTRRPNNIRVDFANDRRWKDGVRALNLNTAYPHAQVFGSAAFQKAGLTIANSKPAQVRMNGVAAGGGAPATGHYAHNEELSSEFNANHYPDDSGGNCYRGIRIDGGAYANLTYLGSDPNAYRSLYFKQSNSSEDDWSDLIELTRVLSDGSLTGQNYISEVRRVLNVEEAMLYFAVNTMVDNSETSLSNGNGDDYALYRGVSDSRFNIMGYDVDTIMGQGDSPGSTSASLFRMLNGPSPGVAVTRLMNEPEFLPIYYATLKRLIETTFSAEQINPLLDRVLGDWVPVTTISAMKNWQAARNAFVLSQIPLNLTATSGLARNNGYFMTTTATVSLNGQANVIDTRSVRVNGVLATWNAFNGTWNIAGLAMNPGINRVLVQAFGTNGTEIAHTTIDIWYNNSVSTPVSGEISGDVTWTPSGGPYLISGALEVNQGSTLRILPGTSVYFGSGASLAVLGRMLAEGTETNHIRFTRQPGGANWTALVFEGATEESRLAYADIEFAGGTTLGGHNAEVHVINSRVFFDHLTFTNNPVIEYISFDNSSFIVQNSFFPTYPGPTGPEMLHGVNGIPANGYGIFRDNYFGHTWGFNDTIDFTGGNRPGAILQIINNVFDGASDDHLDLDSTDAWIEGNIFMHAHRDPASTASALDTSSAISGGVDNVGQNPDWTIINNIFYDVDHVFLNKGNSTSVGNGGGRVAFLYNTVIHVAKEWSGSTAAEISAFNWSDDNIALPDPAIGSGMYAAYNIIYDCTNLHRFYNPANHTVIMDNNILSVPWSGPGSSNQVIDPLLNLGVLGNTSPTNVTVAQVRQAAQLRPGSPARGIGFGGLNLGGFQPHGIAIDGAPNGTTPSTSATLTVGPGGTFNWGTNTPQAWGWTAFKWKLDNGAFSAEIPFTNDPPFTNLPTIVLSNLSNGPHTVSVIGKNDAGRYQDDTLVYPVGAGIPGAVSSKTWTVNTNLSQVIINEVLAQNTASVLHGETYPDVVELHNPGATPFNLSGVGVTDDPADKFKFRFPQTTSIAGGEYLVLYAANPDGTAGFHLGFNLNLAGDAVYLYDTNGVLIDSIVFGKQLADLSIGRLSDGSWGLNHPTFGAANIAQPASDGSRLKINEWLTESRTHPDFIELFNPDPVPANIGRLYISDAPDGAPKRYQIPALSFIAASGYLALIADGHPEDGADHLDFKLSPNQGQIALLSSNLTIIDCVIYGIQTIDISEGRQPNGGSQFVFFDQPTPGGPNLGSSGVCTITSSTINLIPMISTWRYDRNGSDLGTAWRETNYDDSGWLSGTALIGIEDCNGNPPCIPFVQLSLLSFPSYVNTQIPYYFRTTFQVTTNLSGFTLAVSHVIDDGAVIYIDGTELSTRIRMPSGPINAFTLPIQTVDNATLESFTTTFPLSLGTHTIAVEVHNRANPTSSDIVFGLALDASHFETNCVQNNLVLNEIMANNQTISNLDGTITDWVEIYNASANAVDLSDMSLSDDPMLPRRWVIPTGARLASGAYLVVKFDSSAPASLTTNTLVLNSGFGLDADTDAVFLFDSPSRGGAALSSRSFGIQPVDFSLGRIPNGQQTWTLTLPTPGGPNIAAALGSPNQLKFNEWMASPNNGDDWFELYNPNALPVNISGLYLTDDITLPSGYYQVPAFSYIGGGVNGYVQFLADNNVNKGANHTNFKLAGSGETLGLLTPARVIIDTVTFFQQQGGVSEGRFPDGSTNYERFPGTETPAASNLRPLYDIVINEVLTHTDPPFEDAIELYNPTSRSIDISGWYLSDNKGDARRFRIPDGTVIASGGFAVFYENQFNPDMLGRPPSFALSSSKGDDLYLFPADSEGNFTGYRASIKFGPAENGVSFGRYHASDKVHFTALSQRTFGADNPADLAQFRTGRGLPNAYPKVGPIVISEIQYHPPEIVSGNVTNDNVVDEFIEVQNITSTNVALYDLAFPSNKWRLRDAVGFTFPDNFSLLPGEYAVIVSFDPSTNAAQTTAFRNKYGMTQGMWLLGPYDGKLDNNSDSVELVKPDAPQPLGSSDAGLVPYILADKVEYHDSGPWPKLADGPGNSLQRRNSAAFGDDPANWFAGAPTAGATNGVAAAAVPSISNLTPSHSRAVGVSDTFTVTANGAAPLSYQWYFNGSPIANATNLSYTIGSVQATNAGDYSVLVWNTAGSATALLHLDVQLAPLITQQPQSRVAALGQQATFTVGVQASLPLTYQWFRNSNSIPNATNAVYAIAIIQESDEGNYFVAITNQYGFAISFTAQLSLNAAPVIVVPPQSTNVFVGSSVTFSVIANGTPPLRYQWRIGNADIPLATNSTYTINNVQLTNAGNYTVRVSNIIASVISAPPATLTVTIPPRVAVYATDATASEPGGDSGMFTLFRTNGVSLPLTVAFVVGGTATPDSDYVALASPITFAAGQASTNIFVSVLDDALAETAETVALTLLNTSEYIVASPSNAVVTILDDDNLAPSVTLTNPPSGSLFNAGDDVSLTAVASDPDGSISKVEFFYDATNKVGEVTSFPYTGVWAKAVPGNHVLTAVATDNLGKSATSAGIPVIINARPVVTISSPATGSTFFTPANIPITATAVDADGISLVQFFAGATLIGSDNTFPYSITWSNVAVGNYSLTARATDTRGASATSAVVTVTVSLPTPNFNDMFALRGVISGYTNFVRGTNTPYTKETGEPDHDGKITAHSGWLSWTAPVSGLCIMDTYNSTFDTVLAVYTNRPPGNQFVTNLVAVASNDDFDDTTLQSRVSFAAVSGVTYQIAVDGYGTGLGSTGTIAFHMSMRVGPSFPTPFQAQTVDPGVDVTFNSGAGGTPPLTYQWRLNGTPLIGGNGSIFVQQNVQYTHGGIYSVVVGNSFGQATNQAELYIRPTFTISPPVMSNGFFRLTVNGTPGKRYSVEGSGNLTNWTAIGDVTNSAVQMPFQDPLTSSNRTYRLRLVP